MRLVPWVQHGGRRWAPQQDWIGLSQRGMHWWELVWVGEGGAEARRAQGTHRLGGLAVLRRIRSSRRLAGRAVSRSRLLARLPSGGGSAHVAPVLLVRAAWWGNVSWGGQAVTRTLLGAFYLCPS